jgi:hypothetical protein
MAGHPDDSFHPPTSDDPFWTETCWFTFAVPQQRLSGQLYPFFRPNQGVCSAGAFFWDETGSMPWNCLYAKNFWHLPMPEGDLTDCRIANGIHYRCLEPLSKYELQYVDPDDGEVEVNLTFEAICPPNYLAGSHLDQPGRYTGSVRLKDQEIAVNSFGMRDRSWGVRSQFGTGLHSSGPGHGGYSYATASESQAFHAITMDFGDGCVAIHGFLLRDGEYAKLASGRREVLERKEGYPTRVRLEATDELGRELQAAGRCVNRFGIHLNPNLFTWNCLTEWQFGSVSGWGEDHDNWSAAAFRRFIRGEPARP